MAAPIDDFALHHAVLSTGADIAYARELEVAGAGHFLMWERPRVFNRALEHFCLDLVAQSRPR